MKEDLNIVWTRGLACLLVVLVHVAELWHYMYNADSNIFRLTAFIVALGRPSVPLFFMISGYLLFSQDKNPSFDLVWKRFLAIFQPLAFFFFVYYLYQIIAGYGWNPVGSSFLQKNVAHLWYLGFMLPVYTFSPFIRPPHIENIKQCMFFLGILFFIFVVTESMMAKPYPFLAEYSFNQPLLYMMIGYLLKYINLKNKSFWLKSIFVGSFLLITMINFTLILIDNDPVFFKSLGMKRFVHILEYIFGNQGVILDSFKTTGVLLQSVFLFLSIQSIRITRIQSLWRRMIHRFLAYISTHSLSIYGWHILFVHLIRELALNIQMRYAFPMIFLGALPCSLVAGYASTYIRIGIQKILRR